MIKFLGFIAYGKAGELYLIVCTMDLKQSKSYTKEKRKLIQKIFIELIDKINNLNQEISANITTGDEAEILFSSPNILFRIIYLIDRDFQFDYHMGIGIGEIEGPENEIVPSRLYGDAFYLSRDAVEASKKRNEKIIIKTENNEFEDIINSLFSLTNHIKKTWTKKQKDHVNYMFFNEQALQLDAAAQFNVTPQAISQSLNNAGYDSVRNGETIIMKLISKIE